MAPGGWPDVLEAHGRTPSTVRRLVAQLIDDAFARAETAEQTHALHPVLDARLPQVSGNALGGPEITTCVL